MRLAFVVVVKERKKKEEERQRQEQQKEEEFCCAKKIEKSLKSAEKIDKKNEIVVDAGCASPPHDHV